MARPEFEELIDLYYQPLYRFAFSLAKDEADASDLVQQTFLIWARKGHQLRDDAKVKTWLFTTLRREFLGRLRKAAHFVDGELDPGLETTPAEASRPEDQLDAREIVEKLYSLPKEYKAPLALFYLEEHSYQEIADILEIPIGTVMSRLSRGKQRLRALLDS